MDKATRAPSSMQKKSGETSYAASMEETEDKDKKYMKGQKTLPTHTNE